VVLKGAEVQSPVAYPWSGRQAKSTHKKKRKQKSFFFFSSFETHYQAFAFYILYLYNIRKLFHWFDLHTSVMLFV